MHIKPPKKPFFSAVCVNIPMHIGRQVCNQADENACIYVAFKNNSIALKEVMKTRSQKLVVCYSHQGSKFQ